MKTDNIILEKSFHFALRIINLHLFFREKKVDRVLSTQLLRAGTSIGATVEETIGGSSRKDFNKNLRIAYRKARETQSWLRLLQEGCLLKENLAVSMITDSEEIKNFDFNSKYFKKKSCHN